MGFLARLRGKSGRSKRASQSGASAKNDRSLVDDGSCNTAEVASPSAGDAGERGHAGHAADSAKQHEEVAKTFAPQASASPAGGEAVEKAPQTQLPAELSSEQLNPQEAEALRRVEEKLAENLDDLDAIQEFIDNIYIMKMEFKVKFALREHFAVRLADRALQALDSVDLSEGAPSARVLYLRGKALDSLSSHSSEAEELLTKAVKLDPSIQDAWSCLGNVLWKKRDAKAATECLRTAVKTDGRNADARRQLSKVLRAQCSALRDAGARKEAIEDGLKEAKAALAIDFSDAESWETVGTSYVARFFHVSRSTDDLHNALKAYTKAAALAKVPLPDMYFNKATVHYYLAEFDSAIASLKHAADLDPSLPVSEFWQTTVGLLVKVARSVEGKGGMKRKRLVQMLKSIPPSGKRHDRDFVLLSALQAGHNAGKAIEGKVVAVADGVSSIPVVFVLADKNMDCIAVMLYNVKADKITVGDTLAVLDPEKETIESRLAALESGQSLVFDAIKVKGPSALIVNGARLGDDHFSLPGLAIDTKGA